MLSINSKFPYSCIKKFFIFSKFVSKYDIYHFHGGTLLPKSIDSILWKIFGKKLIIHHHGSELRFKGEEYIYSMFADNILVSTPDLLEPIPQNRKMRILHVPSSRKTKGTEYVIQAIDRLKKHGYDI